MELETNTKKLPDQYINTGKATILAVIKLIEALVGSYALYYVIMNPQAVQKVISDFYNGLTFSTDVQSSFYSVYRTLSNSIQVILAIELLLIVLDGLGSFFTRVAHKGSGFVKFVHIVRYFFSLITFIGSFVVIFQYTMAMIKAAQAMNKINFSDVFTFLGSYELILYIIFVFGILFILMEYDRFVARVMKQVSKEIKAGEIQIMQKKNQLGRESAWLAGILSASAVLSVVELIGGGSMLANIVRVIKPVEILYYGSNSISIAVVSVLAVKYFLINRCSADFDRAHR